MKQSEMTVGMEVELGRRAGGHGISSTGTRAKVLATGLGADKWSKRKDHVQVVLLDAEGNERMYEDNERNRKAGQVGRIMRTVPAQLILSAEVANAKRDAAEAAAAERARRAEITVGRRMDIEDMLGKLGFGAAGHVYVIVNYVEETGQARIDSIKFHGKAADMLVALLTKEA